jgi:Cu2+-containing amine oxidase
VCSRLYSAGLQCNDDHRHHAYWRFDFDINDAGNDAYEYNTTTPDIGFGPGWHKKWSEISRLKNPATGRRWAVMDKRQGNGYFVIPDPNDGVTDSFSRRDVWLMRHHGTEDRHGNQGSPGDDGLDSYLNFENLDGTDLVLWYCGQLSHHADDGADEWHAVGPRLVPFRW